MKKIVLLAAGLFLMMGTASAQEGFGWGVKAGFNVANITNMLTGYGSKLGFTAGAFADYRFTERWAASADLLYSGQGSRFNGDNKSQLHYLNIPILANFYIIDGLAVKAGPQIGFMVGSTNVGSIIGVDDNAVDFSIPVGVSYEFPMGLIVDARYGIGVSKVYSNTGNTRNSVFSITAGWRF